MKGISQRLSLAAVVVATVSLAICFAQFGPARAEREGNDASTKSLRGRAAHEYLKQSGLYESLADISSFTEQSKLLADDGAAQDNFGYSVAVSGDTAVVGSPRDQVGSNAAQGSAYVYVRANGVWTQQQKLTAADGAAADEFGYAVAIEGDTIFVGRHNTQQLSNRTRGAVYVYTRSGSTWTQGPSILSGDGVEGDNFGVSLAVDGDTLVVGAQLKNNGTTFFQGAAYVFTGSGAAWTQQAKLLASDGAFANFFGTSVAVSGDTVVVGSPGQPGTPPDNGRGSAYVYTRSGSAWTQQQKLLASDGAAGDQFGFSVGVSGDTAVVGARLDTVNGVGAQGSVYVFTRSGTAWTEQQHLFGVEQIQRNDQFGYAVAISGDAITVGSPLHEVVPGIANHGAVYVFARSGSTWARTQKLIHSDPSPDGLGQAVALDGTSVLAGAPAKNSNRGAAYVFNLVTDAQPKLVGSDLSNGAGFGRRVAINDDTALVSSLNFGTNLFRRSGTNWEFVRKLQGALSGNDTAPMSGGVALNADTMIVGSMASRANNIVSGAAYVFTRSGADWVEQQRLLPSDATAGQSFGGAIAVSGNTAVVSAYNTKVGSNDNQGAVYVFTRSGSTWTEQQKLTASDGAAQDNYGWSVALSGDTIIVGANLADVSGKLNQGAAYVYTRTGSTWTERTKLLASDGADNDSFGQSVALEGTTAVVSSQGADIGTTFGAGAVYVFNGSGATWTQQQKLFSASEGNFSFGESVALSGGTLVVGAPNEDDEPGGFANNGAALVYKLSGGSWQQTDRLIAFDRQTSDQLGSSVAISGTRVIAGAISDDMFGLTGVGSAYVFDLDNSTATPTPTPTPTATPTPTPEPTGTVLFTTATYNADEGAGTTGGASFGEASSPQFDAAAAGSVTLTVTRTGDTSGAASVDFDTQDGTASARTDYTAVSGTLRFAAGETSKSIVVHVTDDRFQESQETFSVALSNPVGVNLGSPSTASVQVTSDDTSTGPSPVSDPNFDVDFFVRQHYADFLGREADAAGLNFWKNEITQCETRPEAERQPCREVKRVNVSAAFFLSIEFQQTGFYVYLLHQAAFNSGEHLSLRQFNADVNEARKDVVVGQGAWEQQLQANKLALALLLVRRQAFTSAYPASMTPAQFVDALNANTGGSLGAAERDARVAELTANNTDEGRAAVLLKVTDNAAFRAREFNRAFVLMQYFGYLRREPDDSPDSNFTGYNFWLAKLNQFNGNFIAAEMVKAFISSEEYKKRFGQ